MVRASSVRRYAALGPVAALAAVLTVAGCSSGPTDFIDTALAAPTAPAPAVGLSAADRTALEQDLVATADRTAAAGSSADAGVGPPLALSAIGEQQSAAARALIAETQAGTVAAPADPRVIPGGAPILCADGQSVAADGLCPARR